MRVGAEADDLVYTIVLRPAMMYGDIVWWSKIGVQGSTRRLAMIQTPVYLPVTG